MPAPGRLFPASALLGALAWLAAATAARAGTVEVAPVVVEMVAPVTTSVLSVKNRGTRPASIQVRAFEWTQGKSTDTLTPTRDLVVSPPIFEVAAGSAQTVRLMLRQPPGAKDTAYRLLLDELPPADSLGLVHMALRISLPVFGRASTLTAADLKWSAQPAGRDATEIVAVNRGTAPERVTELMLAVDRAGPWKATPLVDPWILPGTERHWRVPLTEAIDWRGKDRARLTAKLRTGSVDVLAPVTPAP